MSPYLIAFINLFQRAVKREWRSMTSRGSKSSRWVSDTCWRHARTFELLGSKSIKVCKARTGDLNLRLELAATLLGMLGDLGWSQPSDFCSVSHFTHLSGPGRRKCTTPSLSGTWRRRWRSTVSTSQARMTRSAATITSRESLIRRLQAPGTPSTRLGRSSLSATQLGQAPARGRWLSPPRSWVERPSPLVGDRSPRTTFLNRTPSSSRGDPRKPPDQAPQVRLWGQT